MKETLTGNSMIFSEMNSRQYEVASAYLSSISKKDTEVKKEGYLVCQLNEAFGGEVTINPSKRTVELSDEVDIAVVNTVRYKINPGVREN